MGKTYVFGGTVQNPTIDRVVPHSLMEFSGNGQDMTAAAPAPVANSPVVKPAPKAGFDFNM